MPRVRMSEDVITSFNVQRTQPCQCGRRSTFIHCPHCGSTNFYGLSEKSRRSIVFSPNGDELHVRVFACKACLRNFMENESTLACKAEPTAAQERENVAFQRVAERVSPEVSGEVADYVRKLAEKRGIRKPPPQPQANPQGLLERVDAAKATGKPVEQAGDVTSLFETPKLSDDGDS